MKISWSISCEFSGSIKFTLLEAGFFYNCTLGNVVHLFEKSSRNDNLIKEKIMISINPFSEIGTFIPSFVMQTYVVAMFLLSHWCNSL